jgi:cell wall-associated NlpC family hydrolase
VATRLTLPHTALSIPHFPADAGVPAPRRLRTPRRPQTPRRRRAVRLLSMGAVIALPLSLFAAAGSSSAAPTLTVPEAQQQLAALQAKSDAAVEAFDAGQIATTSAQHSAAAAQAKVGVEQKKLAAVQQRAAAFAVSAYTTGGADSLTDLLDGQNPATVLDRAANLNQVARSRTAQLTALDAERTTLAGLQKTAQDRAADVTKRQQALAQSQSTIKALVAKQQAVLNKLQADQRAALLAQQAAAQAAATRASRSAFRVPLAGPSTSNGVQSDVSTGAAPSASGIAGVVLAAAYAQRGKPYVYGGAGPNSFDCSGLVMWAFAHAGVSLPHSAAAQYGYGTHVSRDQLQPGDIVFYDEGGSIEHDGIYVGGGMMIDANHTGGWIDVRPLYGGFVGGTRL